MFLARSNYQQFVPTALAPHGACYSRPLNVSPRLGVPGFESLEASEHKRWKSAN